MRICLCIIPRRACSGHTIFLSNHLLFFSFAIPLHLFYGCECTDFLCFITVFFYPNRYELTLVVVISLFYPSLCSFVGGVCFKILICIFVAKHLQNKEKMGIISLLS